MPRKRLTQLFPALIPLRQAQRRLFCLAGMRLDRRRYAGTQWGAVLPQRVFAYSSPLLNPDTGDSHDLRVIFRHRGLYTGDLHSFKKNWQDEYCGFDGTSVIYTQ